MYVRSILFVFIFPLISCASTPKSSPPKVVESVDLKKYAGEWYEIATFPMIFQWGCGGAKATYKVIDDSSVSVLNECQGFFGIRDIEGVARVVDPAEPAKLEVDFGWGRKGEYWIIDLAKDYSHAVVSNSKRSSLWILYRKPTMPDSLYKSITDDLKLRGFDLSDLERTKKPINSNR